MEEIQLMKDRITYLEKRVRNIDNSYISLLKRVQVIEERFSQGK